MCLFVYCVFVFTWCTPIVVRIENAILLLMPGIDIPITVRTELVLPLLETVGPKTVSGISILVVIHVYYISGGGLVVKCILQSYAIYFCVGYCTYFAVAVFYKQASKMQPPKNLQIGERKNET